MICAVTYIDVQPPFTSKAIGLLQHYTSGCRGAGSLAASALRELHRQNRMVFVEAWQDEAAFQAHEASATFQSWREQLSAIHNSPMDRRIHSDFAIGPAPAVEGGYIAVTHVDVPPPRREETEVLLRAEAGASRSDEGCLGYDVFQQTARPNHFTVIAVWRDERGFTAHEAGIHTRQFREALGPLLGALYDERLFRNL